MTAQQIGLKDRLWKELALKAELNTDGAAISREALAFIAPGVKTQEQVHTLFEMDFEIHDDELPAYFRLDHGLVVPFRWNPDARHRIVLDGMRGEIRRAEHLRPPPGEALRLVAAGEERKSFRRAGPDRGKPVNRHRQRLVPRDRLERARAARPDPAQGGRQSRRAGDLHDA